MLHKSPFDDQESRDLCTIL